MNRRSFLQTGMTALGSAALPRFSPPAADRRSQAGEGSTVSSVRSPLAIAMWHFSWLLRHHRLGEFADWDWALDGLAERGYDALRIDGSPIWWQRAREGELQEDHIFHPKGRNRKPASARVGVPVFERLSRPRELLIAFLTKCRERRSWRAPRHLVYGPWHGTELGGRGDGRFRTRLGRNLDGSSTTKRPAGRDPVRRSAQRVPAVAWLRMAVELRWTRWPVLQPKRRRKGNAGIPDGQPPALSRDKQKYSPQQKAFYDKF